MSYDDDDDYDKLTMTITMTKMLLTLHSFLLKEAVRSAPNVLLPTQVGRQSIVASSFATNAPRFIGVSGATFPTSSIAGGPPGIPPCSPWSMP